MRSSLIRPLVHKLHAYVPGEQPKIKGLIKLNTNENPYPPSPRVLQAVKAAVDGRLRLYPNPTAQLLREKLAKLHGCGPENIIIGNGSDEVLAMAVRAFCPADGIPEDPVTGSANAAIMAFLAEAGDPAGYGLHYRASQGREVGRDGYVEVVRDAATGAISIGGACAMGIRGEFRLG